MTTVTRSVDVFVRAPLQPTFEYVSDLRRHPEWNERLSMEEVTSGPMAVGKEFASRGKVAVQNDRRNRIRISSYAAPNKFGFLANDLDFGDVLHEFDFRTQGEGVQITRRMTLHLNPIVAFFFSILVYPLIGRSSMVKSFAALKARLEGSSTIR